MSLPIHNHDRLRHDKVNRYSSTNFKMKFDFIFGDLRIIHLRKLSSSPTLQLYSVIYHIVHIAFKETRKGRSHARYYHN
ncbi:hypothetical protein ACTXT7_003044 [Hymenolepis weldensis]